MRSNDRWLIWRAPVKRPPGHDKRQANLGNAASVSRLKLREPLVRPVLPDLRMQRARAQERRG
jgi:hypothetical protein